MAYGKEDYGLAFDLREAHVSVDDDGASAPIPMAPTFWPDVLAGRRQLGRWLLGANHRTESTAWDRHPRGECVLVLLTGSIDIVLAGEHGDDTDTVVQLHTAGSSVVVPRGVWHRQVVHEPSDLLFLTAGESTERRPVNPG